MQTFVTYFDHAKTAADLDDARLNKQCLEVIQILRVLRGERDGYTNHPAVQMWEGYEPALLLYGLVVCHEWRVKRKRENKVWYELEEMSSDYWSKDAPLAGRQYDAPPWSRDKWVVRSHRSNLMRKAPHHYGKLYAGTPENMPYLWPVVDHRGNGYYLRLSKPDAMRLDSKERVIPDGLEVHEYIPSSGIRESYCVSPEEY